MCAALARRFQSLHRRFCVGCGHGATPFCVPRSGTSRPFSSAFCVCRGLRRFCRFDWRYVPLLDYPAHLANLYIFRHLNDPALGFSRYYETNLAPLPYWVQYGIEYGLSIFVGEELAQSCFFRSRLVYCLGRLRSMPGRLGVTRGFWCWRFPLAWNMNVANGFWRMSAVCRFCLSRSGRLPNTASSRLFPAPQRRRCWAFCSTFRTSFWGARCCARADSPRWSAVDRLRFGACWSHCVRSFQPLSLGLWAQLYGDADKTRVTVRGAGLHDIQGVWTASRKTSTCCAAGR